MRKRAICAALMTAALFAMTPDKSYGLAALAEGAKTSCKPTAPAGSPLYRTQVNCDPADVQSFQLTFTYDISKLTFVGAVDLNGFHDTASFSTSFETTGIITMSGTRDTPLAGEHDAIGLIFDLNRDLREDPTAYTVPLDFHVTAVPNTNGDGVYTGDFIKAVDETTHKTVTYRPDFPDPFGIAPSEAHLSMTDIHDQAVPLPKAAYGGFALLGAFGLFRATRRRPVTIQT